MACHKYKELLSRDELPEVEGKAEASRCALGSPFPCNISSG